MYYIGIGCEVGQLYRGASECGKKLVIISVPFDICTILIL